MIAGTLLEPGNEAMAITQRVEALAVGAGACDGGGSTQRVTVDVIGQVEQADAQVSVLSRQRRGDAPQRRGGETRKAGARVRRNGGLRDNHERGCDVYLSKADDEAREDDTGVRTGGVQAGRVDG